MVRQILVLDENKKLTAIFNSEGKNNFFNDEYYSELATGAETLQLSFKVNEDNAFVKEGYYLLFFIDEKCKMFQIKTCTDDKSGNSVVRSLYSEFIGINLKNHFIRPCVIDGNIETVLNNILVDVDYEVGYISSSLENNIQTIEIKEVSSVYSILQNSITTFGNIEYEFDVKIIDASTGKYQYILNVYDDGERGNKTYKRFEDGRNIISLKRTVDITNMCSGLIATGSNGITFKNEHWEKAKGFPLDKPKGDDFLIDPEIDEIYNNNGQSILGNFKSDATTGVDLLWDTYYKLQEIRKGKITFDTTVELTNDEYEEINVGDIVYVISKRFNPEILQEARIATMKLSFTNHSKNEITFSNYKEVKSKIKNWTTQDVIDEITGFTGKLTQADIDKIREYLASLDIKSEEIEKLLKKWEDSLKDSVVEKDEISEDTENYKDIKLDKIDNGLWLGDERIYDLKKNKCVGVTTSTSTETTENSSASAKEYKNAVEYYSKFSLGTYANKSSLSSLISSSNKYKISTIVKYWSKKFGLDPYLVYAVIMAESSGNPYCKTKTERGGYGIMQCERAAYFNRKQTIKYLDGSTKSFTPSYSTMTPGKSGKTTLNGVSVDKNISNQIMFGCHELRKSLVRFKYNIFAALMGYNFGLYGADWVVCKYVANKNNLNFVDKFGYTAQSSKVQELYFKELETLKAPWANLRKTYVSQKKMGTATNIEYYLRWYKVINGQLPYVLDSKGNKKGYGSNKSTTTTTSNNTTIKTGVATTLRNKIVAKAKEIVNLHVKYKTATYNQVPRTIDDSKRIRWKGTHYGIKNPYVYDCSSFVSCCYKAAGLTSVYNKSCSAGTLISSATKNSGYKMWKVDTAGLKEAIPGDIVMDANFKVTSSNLTASNMSKVNKTHHTMIYIGDGKVAHASKWAYHPEAIKISNISYYQNKGTAFFLRPYDLAAKDKSATTTTTGTTTGADKVVETNEITIKGLPLATPADYISDTSLIENVTINNIEDDEKYPKAVSHVFCHFGINDLTDEGIENYKSLIKALLVKYPKKPIFIAKEYHVNTQYPNHATINPQITNFNNAMRDFANQTKYVVIVNNPSQITTNATVDTELTTNGWRMKDKASCDKYYKAYKKAILNMCKKEETVIPTTNKKIDIVMENGKTYKYKNVDEMIFKLPSKVKSAFWSKLTFTTTSKNKVTQSKILYLKGTDCKAGALLSKPNTTYNIFIYPSTADDSIKEKYIGNVVGVSKGSEFVNYKNFKGMNDVVKIAETYYAKKDKFQYGTKTVLTYDNPAENIDKWKVNGLYNIDCSTLIGLIFRGLKYQKSPYAVKTTKVKKSTAYSWAFNFPRTAADQAKYCVDNGWVLPQIDTVNFSNVEAGDLIFWDRDNKENGRYMNCSHVAMCLGKDSDGDTICIEATNVTGAFRKIKIKNNTADKFLFVARVKKY